MRHFLQYSLNGLTVCLGIAIILAASLHLPWIMQEILHPTGSFGGPINRFAAQLYVAVIGTAATGEVLLLGVLLSQHWLSRSLGITAMLISGAIALLSLLGIFILRF
ncbi:hypothetical protein BST81_26265 [Leptolyngbya sp. 'hensonii']|uniref:hypothetical protein n=1 Tax=Leptolyngbya sp. 'hensonii' TaxID=1922337 RepID=UPI00094FF456|nr:hypothetical protein [Leptolyngbya sp. 'hensonii']OLP15468.1 hypothetical protein BST81_26265 [Leptolyngbya sp. 'hensonii']